MKKKYYIIPIVAIVLAVLTGLFISLFTTPVLAYITENKSPSNEIKDEQGYTLYYDYEDWFYTTKKVGKIIRTAYKLNPSMENLDAVCSLYSTDWYIKGTHKGNTPPIDYLKNCVKYAKIYYESEYVDGEDPYAVPSSSFTDNPIFMFHKMPRGLEYAKALYLDGQTEESQKIFEEVLKGLDTNNMHDCRMFVMLSKGYLYLVYSSTENVTLKQWILETEAELQKLIENEDSTKNYIEKHGFLFSNPDYDTFVRGDWPDNDPIEDENTERISDETVSEVPTP